MALLIADICDNGRITPWQEEAYGIELEAENYPTGRWRTDQAAMAPWWRTERDGSLREGGVEFISTVLCGKDQVELAINLLYNQTGGRWSSSVRTGIHIHCNMLPRTPEEVARICAYYAFAEPLMFSQVSPEREQNIYCVPWYRSPGEVDLLQEALSQDRWRMLREACKYSALYCGPLLTYGSIEFRHAQTFEDRNDLLNWWKKCRAVALSYSMPDPVRIYAEAGTEAVLRQLFSDSLSNEEFALAAAAADKCGAAENALRFQPCTYKAGDWGKPGDFSAARNKARPTRAAAVEVLQAQRIDAQRIRMRDMPQVAPQIQQEFIRNLNLGDAAQADAADELDELLTLHDDDDDEEFFEPEED